jgi:hypothetical protein
LSAPITPLRLERFCVKFYAADPGAVELEAVVPVFHRWIQTRALPELLIDVADYAHVPDGPGVVLIGHEADYFLDRHEGPLGLLYNRKRLGAGSPAERLRGALRQALTACRLLERELGGGGLRFCGERLRFVANDRLAMPSGEEAFAALRPELEAALAVLYAGGATRIERDATDPRDRLTVHASVRDPVDVGTLLGRLG